jgi:hypothetical protein
LSTDKAREIGVRLPVRELFSEFTTLSTAQIDSFFLGFFLG